MNRGGDRTANGALAYEVEKAFQVSPLFDKEGTKLSEEMDQVDESALTFSFGMNLKLKKPNQEQKPVTKKKAAP